MLSNCGRTAAWLIWAHRAPYCPDLVIPARHARNSQNMGADKNLGTRQEFTVFMFLEAVYISALRPSIKKPSK
jgi:hypothetical protein